MLESVKTMSSFPSAVSAVLLVNLGSPDSTSVPDVRRYLREFLGDKRVIDLPSPLRSLLLEGIILRTRPKKSAHAYSSVWTDQGSPLMRISESVRQKLSIELDSNVPVYLAMRYGNPSIADVLRGIAADGIRELLLFPQYPHYAMSSWETVVAKVQEVATEVAPLLRISTVQPFFADPDYIDALHAVAAPYLDEPYDHLLFSYHGVPVRHLKKADCSRSHCMKVTDCCVTRSPVHATCYRAQVFATTKALVERAAISAARHSVSFQSRLAGEPWCEPFTDHELARLPQTGVKRLLVLCPAFVADCLETLEEISVSGKETFLDAGGESFRQIPCLNDHPAYISFLGGRVQRWLHETAGRHAGQLAPSSR